MSLPIFQIKRRDKDTAEEYSTDQRLNGLIEGELGYNYFDNSLWIGPKNSTDGRDYSILLNANHKLSNYTNDHIWTNGTTAGPRLSLTEIDEKTGSRNTVITPSIPSASATQSGIVTTGDQIFSGLKTFKGLKIANSNGTISATLTAPTSNATFYFPNTGGTFVTHASRGTAVGDAYAPVYIAATGRATAISYVGVGAGGTGATSQTANRLVWSIDASKIQASKHYANATKIAINSESEPTENFYVSGTAKVSGNASASTVTVGNGCTLTYDSTQKSLKFVFV